MSMKVKWLDEDLTRAHLIHGRWWWRRVATVYCDVEHARLLCREVASHDEWFYESGDSLPDQLRGWLWDCRERELRERTYRRNWLRPRFLPSARVIK